MKSLVLPYDAEQSAHPLCRFRDQTLRQCVRHIYIPENPDGRLANSCAYDFYLALAPVFVESFLDVIGHICMIYTCRNPAFTFLPEILRYVLGFLKNQETRIRLDIISGGGTGTNRFLIAINNATIACMVIQDIRRHVLYDLLDRKSVV